PTKKYRQKIPFEEFKTYNVKNIKIGLSNNKSIWNTKEIKNKEDIIVDDVLIGDVKFSIEYDEKLFSNIFMSSKIGIIFARDINIYSKNLKLNLRLEVYLYGIKEVNLILSNYLSNPRYQKKETCRAEIEYIGDF